MNNQAWFEPLHRELGIAVVPTQSREELEQYLALRFNHLIQHEFDKLIAFLYRRDVSDQKLKGLLQAEPDTDAGLLIARLVIDREIKRHETWQQFQSNQSPDVDGVDRW
jgi:hypothetical protein